MKRVICVGFAVALATTATLGQGSDATQARGMLDTYCAGCHNSRVRAGGVAFDTLSLTICDRALRKHADVWEAAVRKLRGRLMPPPGSRQPDQREIDAFVTWMEAQLDRAARRAASRATCRSSA